ncbi:hypothetical protein LINPERHAP1_LOCUS4858 [Linum perenne]
MGRAAFFTGGSQKGISDLGGFTLLVQLWALEIFPHIAKHYIEQGAPPADDSIPRGLRWIPSIRGLCGWLIYATLWTVVWRVWLG